MHIQILTNIHLAVKIGFTPDYPRTAYELNETSLPKQRISGKFSSGGTTDAP